MSNTTDGTTDGQSTTDPGQTHCPGCGQHQLAAGALIIATDGSWKCVRCTRRDAVVAQPGDQMVAITCPTCGGSNRACLACAGMGKVRVPMSRLNAYDQTGQQVLTEG